MKSRQIRQHSETNEARDTGVRADTRAVDDRIPRAAIRNEHIRTRREKTPYPPHVEERVTASATQTTDNNIVLRSTQTPTPEVHTSKLMPTKTTMNSHSDDESSGLDDEEAHRRQREMLARRASNNGGEKTVSTLPPASMDDTVPNVTAMYALDDDPWVPHD
jgi:hypothetical protein